MSRTLYRRDRCAGKQIGRLKNCLPCEKWLKKKKPKNYHSAVLSQDQG